MYLGANGEGFLQNAGPGELSYIQEITNGRPFVIRLFGGADAKWAFPNEDVPGLGMRPDFVNWFYDTYKADENSVADREKDIQKAQQDAAEAESFLAKWKAIADEQPDLHFIYNFNVFAPEFYGDGLTQTGVTAFENLVSNGVNMMGGVLGNEVYTVYNFDFDKYKAVIDLFTPYWAEHYQEYPLALCLAPEPGSRREHAEWNQKVYDYINQHTEVNWAVDAHLYLNQEIKDINQKHPGAESVAVTEAEQVHPELEEAFEALLSRGEILSTADYENFSSIIRTTREQTFNEIPFWVTEFNIIPAVNWANTYAQVEVLLEMLAAMSSNVEDGTPDIVCIHNLTGNWLWGSLSKYDPKKDDFSWEEGTYVPRAGYYAMWIMQRMLQALDNNRLISGISSTANLPEYDVEYTVPITIVNKNSIVTVEPGDTADFETWVIAAEQPYHSIGKVGYATKGSKVPIDLSFLGGFLSVEEGDVNVGSALPEVNYLIGFMTVSKTKVAVEPVNDVPTAEITAPDKVRLPWRGTKMIEVNAFNSFDPDGNIASYEFYQILEDGEEVFITNEDHFFIEVGRWDYGQAIIKLRVIDNDGASSTDTHTINFTGPFWMFF